MLYVLLVFDDPEVIAALDAAGQTDLAEAHREFAETIRESGHLRSRTQLAPAATATTLRRHRGKLTMADGTYGGGTEALVGYYEVEATHLDEALALAARVPTLHGAIEVRPLGSTSR